MNDCVHIAAIKAVEPSWEHFDAVSAEVDRLEAECANECGVAAGVAGESTACSDGSTSLRNASQVLILPLLAPN